MFDLKSAFLLLYFFTCYLSIPVTGYKWVPIRKGSELPKNTVILHPIEKIYVGRLIKYNVIIPAEIYNDSYAEAFGLSTDKFLTADNQLEILTSSDECQWNEIDDLSDVPENVVRVGHTWNREPIYLGKTSVYKVASILLSSKQFLSPKGGIFRFALTCGEDTSKWIDTIPPIIPKNAVAISEDNFIARLVGPVSSIPAQVFNNLYFCSGVYKNFEMNSKSCEVLVGNLKSSEYGWQFPSKFEVIPENALVIGKSADNEFIYALRDEYKTLKSGSFSDILQISFKYEILVRN